MCVCSLFVSHLLVSVPAGRRNHHAAIQDCVGVPAVGQFVTAHNCWFQIHENHDRRNCQLKQAFTRPAREETTEKIVDGLFDSDGDDNMPTPAAAAAASATAAARAAAATPVGMGDAAPTTADAASAVGNAAPDTANNVAASTAAAASAVDLTDASAEGTSTSINP